MEDVFSFIVSVLQAVVPQKVSDWLFTLPKVVRYILTAAIYILMLAVAMLAIVLLYWGFHKITGIYLS